MDISLGNRIIQDFLKLPEGEFHEDWNLLHKAIDEIELITGYGFVMYPDCSYWVKDGDYMFPNEGKGRSDILGIWESIIDAIKLIESDL